MSSMSAIDSPSSSSLSPPLHHRHDDEYYDEQKNDGIENNNFVDLSFRSSNDDDGGDNNNDQIMTNKKSISPMMSNRNTYSPSRNQMIIPFPSEKKSPLRVMFLSANTGGGHRASAESLIHQIDIQYPGSTCRIFDLEDVMNVFPCVQLANSYKDMCARPNNWKMFYHFSNLKATESVANMYTRTRCEEQYRKVVESFEPDVVISVHPFLNHVPLAAVRKHEEKLVGHHGRRHIPFFTVVTDLGSGYRGWFQKDVDRIYVASERLWNLAVDYGVSPDRLTITGLPIRHDFTTLAQEMPLFNDNNHRGRGGYVSPEVKKTYQKAMRLNLNLPKPEHPMVLVMGGGEGTGSLTDIVRELYLSFVEQSISATICVVCAKNANLKKSFEETDWEDVLHRSKNRSQQPSSYSFWGNSSSSSTSTSTNRRPPSPIRIDDDLDDCIKGSRSRNKSDVNVVPLGFVTRMAEYMAAASVLVTKAGPGTIAEAAALGLPMMLTSFLPGQEAGNIDIVLEKGFGAYVTEPKSIAETVAHWMKHPVEILEKLRYKAKAFGNPDAASDIVSDIGSRTQVWKARNKNYDQQNNNNNNNQILQRSRSGNNETSNDDQRNGNIMTMDASARTV